MNVVDLYELMEALADELEVEIDVHTDLVHMDQWNSINALFVLARIEQDFHVKISIEDIRSVRDVKTLHALIVSKQYDS